MTDLGVTVSSTFKTSLHCQQPVNRARRILFQLRRGFAVLTPEIFRPLYLDLVRPILEYGRQASSPYLQRDIALMEHIQRLATRMVKGMRELPYEERLRRLNLYLSSDAVFAETSSSPTTFSTDALISRKRNFSRPQRNGI